MVQWVGVIIQNLQTCIHSAKYLSQCQKDNSKDNEWMQVFRREISNPWLILWTNIQTAVESWFVLFQIYKRKEHTFASMHEQLSIQMCMKQRLIFHYLGLSWNGHIHFQISLLFTGSLFMLWKCAVCIFSKPPSLLKAFMPFMPENKISGETEKYVISLNDAEAARKVLNFKSLCTWSVTKEIIICTTHLKRVLLLVGNFPFLC